MIDANFFFAITVLLIAASALTTALVSAVFGLLVNYSPIYTQALAIGQGIAGAIPSTSHMILIYFFKAREENYNGGAAAYFLIVRVTILLSLASIIFHISFEMIASPLFL